MTSEGLGEMFESDSADMCSGKLTLVSGTINQQDWYILKQIPRSMITKLIGPLEIGKVFSVLAAFQAIMHLIASPAYGFIYKRTVATFPGNSSSWKIQSASSLFRFP